MERKQKCPGNPDTAGIAMQGVPGLSKSGLSAWQTACTSLFGPAADLVSYCVHWLSSKIHNSLDINNWRFTVGYNC